MDHSLLVKKNAHLESMKRFGDPESVRMVLPLHDYFEGAHVGAIGCNLMQDNAHELIYETLKKIKRRGDVEEIWVGITETLEEDPEEWFYSDRIYVVGSITEEDLWKMWEAPCRSDDVHPDEMWHGWSAPGNPPINLPHPIPESNVLLLVWD